MLKGAQRTLGDPRLLAVVMETDGSGERYDVSDDQLVAAMCGHGFSMCCYDPFARCLTEMERTGGNTIFVRGLDVIRARVAAAPRFTLVNGSI